MTECKKILVLIASLVILISAVYSDNGTATYSSPSGVPASCLGVYPPSQLYAAAGPAIWGSSGACGRRYRITCTGATKPGGSNPCTHGGASVVVQINDFCPGCAATFDLDQNAFAVIADLNAGSILIEYERL